MRAYMSRQANGSYMLSHMPPVLCKVGATEDLDLYVALGDAFGVRNICGWAAVNIFGITDLEPLQTKRVNLLGTSFGEPFVVDETRVTLYDDGE